jgi:hypothetical protein
LLGNYVALSSPPIGKRKTKKWGSEKEGREGREMGRKEIEENWVGGGRGQVILS